MKIVIGDRRIFGVRGRAQRDTAWIDLKRRRRFALPAHSKSSRSPMDEIYFRGSPPRGVL
ncbi:MAG: hypothetical protein QOH70_1486 [Blastocatellia bacterium]|nr:hypothetical protein [Blastocatellia bacterium]